MKEVLRQLANYHYSTAHSSVLSTTFQLSVLLTECASIQKKAIKKHFPSTLFNNVVKEISSKFKVCA